MKKNFLIAAVCISIFNIILIAQDNNRMKFEFSDIDYGFSTKSILNDPAISYIDTGKGENTIVLVHGLGSNAGFWRYNIPELSKSNRVIAVDLPGYGKSSKDDYPYNMSFFSEALKRFFDELKLKNFYLAGHSMGGQVCITFALAHPEYIKKLILISPAGIESFNQAESNLLKNVFTPENIRLSNKETIIKNISNNFFSWDGKYNWIVEERIKIISAKDFDLYAEANAKSVAGMLDEPTNNFLKNISMPVLIIYGEKDNLIPNKYFHPGLSTGTLFKAGADQIKNCILIPVKNAGHLVYIENPAEVNRIILNFIRN